MNRFHNQSSLLVCDTNISGFFVPQNRILSLFLFKYQFFYDLGTAFASLTRIVAVPGGVKDYI